MNAKWLNIVSDGLVLLGLIILASGWKGSANVRGAIPFHASSVSFNGSATGAYALLGTPCLAIGLILMVVALIWTTVDVVQR
ncbi:MAG TPA: hypothetical protein VMB18_01640 [Terriglobales bacterium]|nr:hypothetical protein [Terriglobales bacterium]